MANNNRKQSLPETSKAPAAAENNSEKAVPTKTIGDPKEVTIKLSNKTLHIVHLDPQTVVINGKHFKRELVKSFLGSICNQPQQQINGKSVNNKNVEAKASASNHSTVSSLSNRNNSVNNVNPTSMLRARLMASESSTKQPNKNPPKPNENEENLFNGNHTNDESLRSQFGECPTLQSILAEIATLQKEYDELGVDLVNKEVDVTRTQNGLSSNNDLESESSSTRTETVARPSWNSTPNPDFVPVISYQGVPLPINIDNENDDSGELVIDEDEFEDLITYENETDSTNPAKSSDWQCSFCDVKLKTNPQLERHLTACNKPKTDKRIASQPANLKIGKVFSIGEELISCDRCNFEATEEEMVKHVVVHFKKLKKSRKMSNSRQFCGSAAKIKTESDDVILIDDDDD